MTLIISLLAITALLVRVGHALLARQSSTSVIADVAFTTLAYWSIGNAILRFTGNGVFGIEASELVGLNENGDWLLAGLVPAIVTAGIVSSAIGKRISSLVAGAISVTIGGFLFPVIAHWFTPAGWLTSLGVADAGGAAMIYLTGAAAATVAAAMTGGGVDHDAAPPRDADPLDAMGLLFLFIGFVPLTITAAANRTAMANSAGAAGAVLLAGAAGAAAALSVGGILCRQSNPRVAAAGLIGGLISATAAGGLVETYWCVIVAAVVGAMLAALLYRQTQLDTRAWIAAHALGGFTAMVFAGLAFPGDARSRVTHALLGLLAAIAICLLSAAVTYGVLGLALVCFPNRSPQAADADESTESRDAVPL